MTKKAEMGVLQKVVSACAVIQAQTVFRPATNRHSLGRAGSDYLTAPFGNDYFKSWTFLLCIDTTDWSA